jgi:hypothetical protein
MYGIAKGGAQRRQPVLTGIVVNNFKFQITVFFIVRGHSPSPAPVHFILAIASVTLPGSFIRRSTRDRVHMPVPPLQSSRHPRDCWPLPVPLQLSPARSHPPAARLKASARDIAILASVLQLHYFSNFILISTRTRSSLFARSSFITWRTTTTIRRCMAEFPFDSCGDWYTGTN